MTPQTLSTVYESAHNVMRNTDGLQPQEAFDELLKYMLFKQCNEKTSQQVHLTRQLNLSGGFHYGGSESAKQIRELFAEYLSQFTPSARDAWSDTNIRLSDDALLSVHHLFSEIELSTIDIDARSAALRMFLSPELRRGLGIYLTPDEVVRCVVQAAAPPNDAVVFDPACGSGTFLVEVAKYWKENDLPVKGKLLGGDINSRMVLIADLNLGYRDSVDFECRVSDAITPRSMNDWPPLNSVDFIFTNPPFGVYVDYEALSNLAVNSRGKGAKLPSEVIFIERCLRWLKPGGLLSVVVPRSVLTNATLHEARCALDELGVMEGVMNLPPETFTATGTQTNTSVLFIRKRDLGLDNKKNILTHVLDVSNVGFDSTGRTRKGSELPDAGAAMRKAILDGKGVDPIVSLEISSKHSVSKYITTLNESRGGEDFVRLGDLVELAETGRTPARTSYADSGAFIVKVGNLTGHGIDWTPRDRNFVNPKSVSDRLTVQPGDILLTSSAHNPIYIARKVDIVGDIPIHVGKSITFVGEVLRLRARPDRIDPFQLLAILRHPSTKEDIRQLIRGQTAHLKPSDLLELRVDETLVSSDLVENLRAELQLSQQINLIRHEQRVLLGLSEEEA